MPRVSISSLIYKSTVFADWVYDSICEFTPMVKTGEAEFFFIANDATPKVLDHLKNKGYSYYTLDNPRRSNEELFQLGYGTPEYIHRVYRGYNESIRRSRGEMVLLINSDNYVSPNWLENLLKHANPRRVVCSQLIERKHPKHPIFPAAYHGEFGKHPKDFNKGGFLASAAKWSRDRLKRGGAYMPCLLYKHMAERVGLYPEGNVCADRFDKIHKFGDEAFFEKLAVLGVEHVTAQDSLVYHLKEGEMDE